MYQKKSAYGGFLTVAVFIATAVMIWYEVQHYMTLKPTYSFDIDSHVGHMMQVNLELTVNTPSSRLTIDLRDASGDALHFSEDDIVKDPADFKAELRRARKRSHTKYFNKMLHSQNRGFTRKQRKNKKLVQGGPRGKDSGFEKHKSVVDAENEAHACRVYGSINVKKVTGNLHISTYIPTFMASRDRGHDFGIDMSHIIHEFSFGDYFPNIAEPLDSSLEETDDPAAVFQYFLSVIPTHYISKHYTLTTNQYSVNDYKRNRDGAAAFPGLYFKYDIEPLTMTVTKKTSSFVNFIIRMCSVLGGLWICTDLGLRIFNRLTILARKSSIEMFSSSLDKEPMPSSQYNTPYFSGPMDPAQGYSAYGTTSTVNYLPHGPGETKYRVSSI